MLVLVHACLRNSNRLTTAPVSRFQLSAWCTVRSSWTAWMRLALRQHQWQHWARHRRSWSTRNQVEAVQSWLLGTAKLLIVVYGIIHSLLIAAHAVRFRLASDSGRQSLDLEYNFAGAPGRHLGTTWVSSRTKLINPNHSHKTLDTQVHEPVSDGGRSCTHRLSSLALSDIRHNRAEEAYRSCLVSWLKDTNTEGDQVTLAPRDDHCRKPTFTLWGFDCFGSCLDFQTSRRQTKRRDKLSTEGLNLQTSLAP